MDKKTLAVVAAAMFGLAACGSGSNGHSGIIVNPGGAATDKSDGASSSGNAAGKPAADNTNQGSSDSKVSTTAEKERYGHTYAYDYTSDGKGGEVSMDKITEDFNLLHVDGRSIQLIPDAEKATAFYRNNAPSGNRAPYTGSGKDPFPPQTHKSWSWIGNDLKHAKYGEVFDQYEKHYWFMQGDSTLEAKIPTHRNTAEYKGKGTHTYNQLEKISVPNPQGGDPEEKWILVRSDFLEADVDFKVNFGEHAVIGEISPIVPDNLKTAIGDKVRKTVVKGVIKGNKFEGAEHSLKPVKTEVFGGFYGPNAEEIAGIYARKLPDNMDELTPDNYPTHGVFGATLQPQSQPQSQP